MSEQSLHDILMAEKAASEKIAESEKAAEQIRKAAAEQAASIDAETASKIDAQRKAALEKLAADVAAMEKNASRAAEESIALWRKRYAERSERIITQLCGLIRGEG